MAQSIKLGNDVYLDASGVDGIKATLTSGDLDDYYGIHKSGTYYLGATQTDFTNAPTGWAGMIVCSVGGVSFQIVWNGTGIYYRARSGNPASWGDWIRASSQNVGRVTGTVTNISLGAGGYVSIGNIYTLGVPQGATVIGVGIRGWNGASDMPISVLLSSDGNTLYATGQKNSTITSLGYFISYIE